jgi:hypothetical protein
MSENARTLEFDELGRQLTQSNEQLAQVASEKESLRANADSKIAALQTQLQTAMAENARTLEFDELGRQLTQLNEQLAQVASEKEQLRAHADNEIVALRNQLQTAKAEYANMIELQQQRIPTITVTSRVPILSGADDQLEDSLLTRGFLDLGARKHKNESTRRHMITEAQEGLIDMVLIRMETSTCFSAIRYSFHPKRAIEQLTIFLGSPRRDFETQFTKELRFIEQNGTVIPYSDTKYVVQACKQAGQLYFGIKDDMDAFANYLRRSIEVGTNATQERKLMASKLKGLRAIRPKGIGEMGVKGAANEGQARKDTKRKSKGETLNPLQITETTDEVYSRNPAQIADEESRLNGVLVENLGDGKRIVLQREQVVSDIEL